MCTDNQKMIYDKQRKINAKIYMAERKQQCCWALVSGAQCNVWRMQRPHCTPPINGASRDDVEECYNEAYCYNTK